MPNAEESAQISEVAGSAAANRAPSGGPATSSGGSASPPAAKKKSRAYRIGAALLGVVVIVFIFSTVIPQFASYHGAWNALVKMSTAWWVAIAAATAINQLVPVWPFQAVLPHLRFRHGFMETETSTTVATTIPAGGALALGLTYRMFDSFGFSNVAVSTAVVTTGVWNLGFKFGLPVVAVVLLAITGLSTGRAVGAALIEVPLSRPGARFRCWHQPVSTLGEQWNGEWRYLEFLQVTSLIIADIFMREIPGGTRARHRSRPVDLPEHRY